MVKQSPPIGGWDCLPKDHPMRPKEIKEVMRPWIGVDLDGTLAEYHTWVDIDHIGVPIPLMVDRVLRWLEEGKDVRIFTARANSPDAIKYIQNWCKEHLGRVLKVTSSKDYGMVEYWDDRAVSVITNTGMVNEKCRECLR